MSTTIESLELQVQSSATSAVGGIDALTASLSKLKNATKGGVGLTSVTNQLRNLNTALSSVDGSADKIDKLANSLSKLKSLGNIKISSSIGNQLKNIGSAAASLNSADLSGIGRLATALQPLNSIGKASGLQSAITQLKKLPELAQTLNTINWATFTSQLQQLTSNLAPLANQLNTVASAFSRLPSNIRATVSATNSMTQANNRASNSYMNLWAKARMAFNAMKVVLNITTDWVKESLEYMENVNLFTVSMGKYAEEAQRYAEQVAEVMGIDPSEWLRNQGVFNTIITGFGVASDKAALMSKNLTQLGYDISSFYNISFEDAMTKLQSGISGELEPLRRLGYDLSVARLQQEALNLGITKSVSAMTQAEKSQLRYYAIMTQVTAAQGDMARTLDAPANQLRILQAQVTQCARALGNVFIPILNAVLPYAIALAKVIRILANAIANLFGFSLPEVDYSGLGSAVGGVEDLTDSLGDAGEEAKKVKNALLGIDELNVLSQNDTASGSGVAGGGSLGDLGIELPEYDFLGDAVSSKVDEIMETLQPMIEWLKTHLDDILDVVLAVGAGFLAWKFANGFTSMVEAIKNGGLNKVAMGITLMVTGITLAAQGAYDIGYEGASFENILKTAIGDALIVGGSLLTFGTGPVGWVVGIGVALVTTITGIVIGANQKALEDDLKARFGELILSSEEITTLVKATLNNDWYSNVQLYLDVQANLDELQAQIESKVKELNSYSWKVRMGLTLTEDEMSSYQSVITEYVDSANQFITDRGYAISIGIEATLNEGTVKDSVLESNATITELLSDDMTSLGTELQSYLNEAFSDGILTIDEQAAIDALTNQINKVLEIVSQSEFEAKLDVIDLKYGMAGLSQESWEAYKEEVQGVADEMKVHAETTVENTLSNLKANIAIAEYYLEQDPNNAEWKNALKEAQEAYQMYMDSNPLELECNNIDMIINDQLFTHFTALFGNELDKAEPLMSLEIEDAYYNAFLNGLRHPDEIYEEPIESLMVGLQNYWIYEFDELDISSSARKNIHEQLADCVPKLEELKDELNTAWESGNAIPQSVKDGLTDIYTYKAMSSDLSEQMEGVTYLIGYELSESPGFYDMLTKADELGWFLNEELALGIKSNLSFVEDASGETVDIIKDGITVATLEMTPELRENMKNLGVNLSEGVTEGVDDGLVEKDTRNIFQKIGDWFCDLFGIHSPSRVFKGYGEDIGLGLIKGLTDIPSLLRNKIKGWLDEIGSEFGDGSISLEAGVELVKEGWSTVKNWIGNIPVVKQAVALGKHLWTTVKDWVGNIPTVEQGVALAKDKWETVKDWVGNIPIVEQGVTLVKDKWQSVKDWIGNIPSLSQYIHLLKDKWTSVKNWIGNIPSLSQYIHLLKDKWTSVKNWIGNIPSLSQYIQLAKSGWDKVKSWVEKYLGGSVEEKVTLAKSGWSYVSSWVKNYIGGSVSVAVEIAKGWTGSAISKIKGWLGLATGGYFLDGSLHLFEQGGYMKNGRTSFWDNIPMYANGTYNAGLHGSMFIAGESGAEVVGHINGQTEVLNRSQISMAMRSATIAGMAQFIPYWRNMVHQMTVCANGIINAVCVSADTTQLAYAGATSYDPTNALAQAVYEDSKVGYDDDYSENNMYRALSDFYNNYLESSMSRMVTGIEKQADKSEKTEVHIGNRVITESVETQQKANGYKFTK